MKEKGLETFRNGEEDANYPSRTIIVGKVYKPVKTENGAHKAGD